MNGNFISVLEQTAEDKTGLMGAFYAIIDWMQPYALPLLILAFVIAGIMMIIPSEEFHQKAVKIIPFALLGFSLVMTAIELAASLNSKF
jgi:hypothetical protein